MKAYRNQRVFTQLLKHLRNSIFWIKMMMLLRVSHRYPKSSLISRTVWVLRKQQFYHLRVSLSMLLIFYLVQHLHTDLFICFHKRSLQRCKNTSKKIQLHGKFGSLHLLRELRFFLSLKKMEDCAFM